MIMIKKRILILICVSCLFSKYLYDEHRHLSDFPLTRALVSQNVYNNSDHFKQNVFRLVDDILIDLQIENESKALPQDSQIKQMEGFEYVEFELLLLDCSFEKFGQFVNRLEKSDKIFVIDRFEFENGVDRGIQRALKSEGVFPGKDISMKIWAINIKKVLNSVMADNKGKELATISVYLNTGIVTAIFAIGFVVAALFFGITTFIIKVV